MTNKKKHILVVSQYFYPEQFRINDLCLSWQKRGYQITVITGKPNYPLGSFFSGYSFFSKILDDYQGIKLIRLPIIPRGKSSIQLCLNYLSFILSGFIWSVFTKIKADHVFIFEVSPMTQALPGIWYAKRAKIPCDIYVQDLWPENIEIITGLKNKQLIALIEKMVIYIYKNCQRIFTTSKSFISAISNRGISTEKIVFWPQYAEEFYSPSSKRSPLIPADHKRFNIIFTGNIGKAQGLDILLESAKELKQLHCDKEVCFHLVGDGRYKEELIQRINEEGLNQFFNFTGKVQPHEIPSILACADFAFLSLADSPLFAMTIPAKLQSYMACGCAILASANGEVAEIINEAQCGFCVSAGDSKALTKSILQASKLDKQDLVDMGNKALRYCKMNYNKEILLDQIDHYFK